MENVEQLKRRLKEAEEALSAIRDGAVDAIVTSNGEGSRVYTLTGADYTYRKIVEQMQEGAVVTDTNGRILYCNASWATMLSLPMERILGSSLHQYIAIHDSKKFKRLFEAGVHGKSHGEMEISSEKKTVPGYFFINAIEQHDKEALSIVISDLSLERENKRYRMLHDENIGMMSQIIDDEKKRMTSSPLSHTSCAIRLRHCFPRSSY